MKQRLITGIVLFLILVPILYLGGYFMLALTMLLSYGAGYELIKMFGRKHPGMLKYRFLMPIYSAILVLINYFVVIGKFEHKFLFLFLIITMLFILIIVLRDNKLEMSCAGLLFLIITYGGLFFGLATSIRYVTVINGASGSYLGLWMMVYVLITTMCTDMGAYQVGSLIGKHKLCPTISPKKTIEGAIGGSIIGAIFGTICLVLIERSYNFHFLGINNQVINVIAIFVLSIFITILGQIGDLISSKLKREHEIKDYSNIFPGHGGIMDRFDSLIITGTFFYIFCLYVGIL